jgi:small subunit ribosomal protein S9
VWLKAGEGHIRVNGKEVHEYFGRVAYRDKLVEPFVVTGTAGDFDVTCTVKGGGTTGQVGAVALGISRALEVWDPAHRPPLAKESLFTRDSRAVERKKPGQPKARKKDQWVKR